jgi:hypothetical protein
MMYNYTSGIYTVETACRQSVVTFSLAREQKKAWMHLFFFFLRYFLSLIFIDFNEGSTICYEEISLKFEIKSYYE